MKFLFYFASKGMDHRLTLMKSTHPSASAQTFRIHQGSALLFPSIHLIYFCSLSSYFYFILGPSSAIYYSEFLFFLHTYIKMNTLNHIPYFFSFYYGHSDQIACSLLGGFSNPRTAATQSLDSGLCSMLSNLPLCPFIRTRPAPFCPT